MDATIGRNTSARNWAEILGLTVTQNDAVVELRTVAGRVIKITIDKNLRPWKANVDGQDVLMLGLGAFNPQEHGRFAWSFPRIAKVKSSTGAIKASLRSSTESGIREEIPGEVQRRFAIVITADGRLWLGPFRSEIVATDAGLTGFMVDDSGTLVATICRERLPMTRGEQRSKETGRSS